MFGFGKSKNQDGPLAETRNWYTDRYEFVVVQRNMLLLVTIVALLGVGGAVFAVAELTSSKTFEPYVIEVEDRTGITTLVTQNSVDRYTQNEALKRYFIWRYITARENYSVMDYEYNYGQVVRLLSGAPVYREFYAFISSNAPDSPVTLGRNAEKRVKLKSMTFLDANKNQVQARVQIEMRQNGSVVSTYNRIITMSITFTDMELSTEDRFINPMGFQVVGYRVDEDAI